jgi:thiamine pyrophosphokinase
MNEVFNFKQKGITFLGGGLVQNKDLVVAMKLAPNLIVADGAADIAIRNNVIPYAAIGDMDSISKEFFNQNPSVKKMEILEQDSTDFEKCLRKVNAKFAIAIGFLGARLDHELAALNAIASHNKYPVLLIGEEDVIFSCPDILKLYLPIGTRVSLFPLTNISVSTEGLYWNLYNEKLSPLERIGTSNISSNHQVNVKIDNQGLLVILPKLFISNVLDAILG